MGKNTDGGNPISRMIPGTKVNGKMASRTDRENTIGLTASWRTEVSGKTATVTGRGNYTIVTANCGTMASGKTAIVMDRGNYMIGTANWNTEASGWMEKKSKNLSVMFVSGNSVTNSTSCPFVVTSDMVSASPVVAHSKHDSVLPAKNPKGLPTQTQLIDEHLLRAIGQYFFC
jgi:hypothetical protein